MDTVKAFAQDLATASGAIIKQYFRTQIAVERKADESPVTIADKKAEEVMREMIMKTFPDHGILGEEFGHHNPDARYQWVLDPIDGTKSFIAGTPQFGTLIALLDNKRPILGVINQPVLGEFLLGMNGGTWLNDSPVRMRECTSIENAVVLATAHWSVHHRKNGVNFDTLTRRARLYRTWGDCHGYYLLATGYADIMLDPVMSVWDIMALIPIVEGAGGVITDWSGENPIIGKSIVAAGPEIHDEVIRILNHA